MSRNRILAIFTVFLVFVLFIAMKPGDNPVILMRVASITAAIIFVGLILYTRILWRVAPFSSFHKIVDIGGKWEGKMVDNEGKICEINAHITQYFDEIKIKIKTDNIFNDSLVCKMSCDAQGTKLYAVYKSKPIGKLDSKEQIENGTIIIKCDEDFLEGTFYTSNRIVGSVELYRK